MAESFTVFGKFGDALEVLGDEDRKLMFYAICSYGAYGEEVELPPYLKALFIAFKEDIDYSKSSRKNGTKGGPKGGSQKSQPVVSQSAEPVVSETSEPVVTQHDEPVVTEPAEPVVSASAEPVVSETDEPLVSENPKANTIQYSTVQNSTVQYRGRGFIPPTPNEVEEYCRGHDLAIDGERFCDFYASKGWLVGRSKMKDWKAAARNWARREGVADDYSQYNV